MPFANNANWIGSHKRFWTREKVIAGLQLAAQQIRGPLPCLDRAYSHVKGTNHLDWPPPHRILEYFGSMARGWLAAGVLRRRVSMRNLDWSQEEVQYLLDHAGEQTIKDIGKHLLRSYGACRKELQKHGVRARDNEGFVSAQQLAKELPCSCDRLRRFLNAGKIPNATFDMVRNRWKIDPLNIDPDLEAALKAPRKTHNSWPLDVGDYHARYGITRHSGKREEVPV